MSREVPSSRFISRNVVEASENEFESFLTPAHFPLSRTPFNAITDPFQYRKDAQDQETEFDLKGKTESARVQQHRLHDRRVEATDRLGSLNFTNATPRLANRHGKTSSEPNSAQSTPARSGSRVSLGGGPHAASRAPQVIGVKSGLSSSYSSRVSRGIYMIDNPDASVQVPHFELVEDSSFWADHNVQVLIRIRPLSTTEKVSQGYYRCLRQESARTLLWLGHPETRFTFDHIASETISQEKLFRVAGLPMVENCMSGYNSSMFAYGQTGSGKTYTMMGQINPVEGQLNVECGITPRIFEYLFQRIKMEEQSRRHEKLRFCCKCSFLEIYNEQITDLLEPSSTSLQLREDLKKGIYVENLTESNVQTADDILKLLLQGAANRKIAATDMNSESSRSHSVLTCIIESQWEKDSMTHLRFARLNLVDLAGSERQKSSGAEGDRLKEAANINKSLSTLGLVIMSLVDLAQGKHRHVPYRDSRLTFLLQDSLGGNSKTTIIANVSPSICAANETLSTLKFAQRAKLIQNNAKVNEDSSGDVTALQRQIQKLKDQLSSLMKHYHVLSSPKVAPGIDEYKGCGNADNNEHHLENLVDDFEMLCIQNKKMQRMKTTLLGALRREKKAENVIHKLEAEIEQMNRLIRQREEDAQCIKMMQRFREEKIKKLESLVTKEISTEKVLIAEIGALKEENQMLQAKIDKNPELTRFALENTRLLEQLQLFQEFYQEGERETLLSEVEELREQLLGVLDEKNIDAKYENQGNDTLKELIECKNMNSKLMREVDGLHAELNNYLTSDSATDSLLSKLIQFRQRGAYSLVTSPIHSNSEDEMDFHTPEADAALEKLKEQKVCSVAVSESRESGKELMDAKLLVSAMEAEQMNLINELQRLRMENEKYVELLDEKEKLASECAPNCRSPCTESQLDKQSKGPSTERNDIDIKALQSKLNSLTDDLENTRMLNQKYKMDHLSYLSCQQQADLVREQVELETSSTIIHLQEEITALQIEINDKISSMADENVKLKDTIATQEKEINIISMEWEKATLDLTGFLIDGSRSLRNASHQIENIASSFPTLNSNIVDHVERAAKVCIDKEEKILALEKSLEDAQKMVAEMDLKLYSLKEAVLAFGEYWQSSSNEPAEVVAELCSYLNENIRIQMPDHQCEFNHNQIPEAENGNDTELEAVKCISDCNKVDLQNNVKRNVPNVKPAASARLSYPICETEGKITTPVEDVTSQLELAKLTVLEAQTAINASYADIEALFSTLQTCTLEPCLAYRELVQDFVREIYEMKIKFLELKGNCNDFGFCVNKLLSLSAFNMMRCQMLCQIKQKLKVTNSTLNTIKDLISIHFEVQTEMDRQSSVSSSSSSISSDSYASPNNLSGSCCSRKVMVTEDMVDKNYQEDPVDDKEFNGQFLERRVLDEAGTHCLRKELMKAFDAFCILYVELNNLLVRKYVQDCSYSEEMKQVIPPVGLTGDNLVPDEAGSCNRGVLSNNRINHFKNFFQRFEEVHATVEEADYMLNTLVNENGSAKALNNSWRRANEELLVEKASLIKEVEQLRNLIHLKEGENVALHDQLHDTLADMANSMSFLEGSFLKMQKEVDENFEILRSGVLSMGQELLSSFPDLRKSLEDTCAMVLENEFVSFATYQCQVGDTARGNSILNVVGGSHSSRQQEHPSTIKSFQKSHSIEQQDLVVCSMDGAEESGSEKFRSLKDQIDLPLNWLINENCLLKKELKRKEVLLEGLLFDLHLLQESASETKDFKDESEKLILALRQTRHELEEKTKQVDDLLLQHKKLESNLVDAQNAVYASTSNLEQAKEEIDSLREENAEMRMLLKELHIKKTEAEEQLDEQREVIKGLEKEVLSSSSLKNDFPFSVEGSDDLRKIISERDHLQEEICSLTHKLEMAHALADEKEATAVEALQMSEASKLYAEQKEDEVKILEHSVEELERTVNMLEKKVYEMDEEVERHRAIRYSLEHELEGLQGRLSTVGHLNSSLVPTSRNNEQTEDQTSRSLEVQEPSMRVLQEERAELRREIETYKEYISEVVLHSEAQASQYQQKYKVLEAMFQEVKKDASNTSVAASENKIDRSSTRTRGSSSPFRCISSLVQQMNLEKDQELSNARLRIVELETLAASRQQEVCMLNTRLAAAESMTHDVIRDLLGVKLDMTNYANIVDQRQIHKLVEEAHQQADEFLAKEQEILKLKKQINDLSKERESCILEINKRDAELLGAKVSVQQLKERDLLLSAHNEMLKKDKNDLIKVVAELEEIIGNTQGTKINQKQVHPTSKTREASPLQVGDVNFGRRCQQSQKLLSRVNDELAMYYMNNRARPHAGASAKGSDTKYRIKKG